MKYYLIFLLAFLLSCKDNTSPFPVKEHSILKQELIENYISHRSTMQNVAAKVSKFKIVRAIDFMNNNVNGYDIEVYCNAINQNSEGKTFTIDSLQDPKLISVLKEENISILELENLKKQLEEFGCTSFLPFSRQALKRGRIIYTLSLDTIHGTALTYITISFLIKNLILV